MRDRLTAVRGICVVLVAAVVAVGCTRGPGERSGGPSGPTSASPPPTSPSASDAEEGSEAGARRSVRLDPAGGSFLVRGRYPRVPSRCRDPEQPSLTARYPGALRVTRVDDGTLTVLLTLPFERYLEGIAEVPASWPRAALEAQAIAARSYALATTGWSGDPGETLDEPICATTACQVYRGIPVPPQRTHRRWVAAVRRTAGRVLVHDGRPATTVYFSTSNGRTYGNEDVFGSSPLPYLRPVVERDDGASSTSRWIVALPLDDLTRFLRAADLWPRGRAISIARPRADAVVLRGGRERRSVPLVDLRDAVNEWAPCLAPERYPGALPITVPSRWLTASADGDSLLLRGRGWGHGVGMVQWGAYGKARGGATADEILGFYYGGLRPQAFPEPGIIRVEVADGLTALRIVPSRSGATLGGRPIGGRVLIAGGDGLVVRR